MAGKKSANRVAFYNLLSTVIINCLSFFVSPVFSRMLGVEQYGVLTVYNTWLAFFGLLVGAQTVGTLAPARAHFDESRQDAYRASAMGLSVTALGICTVVVFLFRGALSRLMEFSPWLLFLMLLHAFGTFCVNFLNTKFTFDFEPGKNFVLALCVSLTTLGLSFALLFVVPQNVLYLGRVLGMAIPYCLLALCIPAFLFIKGRCFYNKDYWRFCLPLCLPVVLHALSGLVLSQSDRVMLQKLAGDGAAGIYGLAYVFSNVLDVLRGTLNNSWVPFYYEMTKQNDIATLKLRARRYLSLFTGLTIGFILLTPEVFRIYAAEPFWDGITYIPVIAVGIYFILLYNFPVNFEFYHRKTSIIAIVTTCAALANVGLNFVLIPRYGALGAAIATLLSYMLSFFAHHISARRLVQGEGAYPFTLRMFAPYLACVIVAMALGYLPASLWFVRWGIGAAVGVVMLLRIRKQKSIF